jgi:hypothetical protein
MIRRRTALAGLMTLLAVVIAESAAGQTLDRRLQSAIDGKDIDAALALAVLGESPSAVWFALTEIIVDCSSDTKCSVALAPVDAEFTQRQKDETSRGIEWPAPVDGLVVVTMTAPGGRGRVRMPYGNVRGQQRILGGRYTAARLAELRAKPTEALVEELFAGGIVDPLKGERRTDWKTAAKPLPAGGGEFGALLLRRTAAMNAAVKARDPDAAVAASGMWGQRVFSAKRYDGAPVPLNVRQLKLRSQSVRFLTEVRVLGGHQLGDQAVLMVEGVNGIGWVERGAFLINRDMDRWDVAQAFTVSHPR